MESQSTSGQKILHIDADSFFASIEQALNPKLKGLPVATGAERGVITSLSIEAKRLGYKRGSTYSISRGVGSEGGGVVTHKRSITPSLVFVPSNYEAYSLYASRFYAILRRFTPDVEEYSIDECFADITGLAQFWGSSYIGLVGEIKNTLERELGITFSLGLAPNKTLAKIASSYKKPRGLVVLENQKYFSILKCIKLQDIWGIGPKNASFLNKLNLVTAYDFAYFLENKNNSANFSFPWVKKVLNNENLEKTWRELRGDYVIKLDTAPRKPKNSLQRFRTFYPPTNNPSFLKSELSKNVENACQSLRHYKLLACAVAFILKSQDFNYFCAKVKFPQATAYPQDILKMLREIFPKIYNSRKLYRASGVVLFNFGNESQNQLNLFGEKDFFEKEEKLYQSVDFLREKFGRESIKLASSLPSSKQRVYSPALKLTQGRELNLIKLK